MLATNWTPTEPNWGDLAYYEVMLTFEGQLKTRTVALCVWKLALCPSTTPYEIETIARRDRDIELRSDGTKVTAYAVKQARKILGFDHADTAKNTHTDRRVKKTKRRKSKRTVTNALLKDSPDANEALRESAAVVDEYLNVGAELAMAQAAFAKAHQGLMGLSRTHCLTLAEIDSNAAQVLAREGLLKPPTHGRQF